MKSNNKQLFLFATQIYRHPFICTGYSPGISCRLSFTASFILTLYPATSGRAKKIWMPFILLIVASFCRITLKALHASYFVGSTSYFILVACHYVVCCFILMMTTTHRSPFWSRRSRSTCRSRSEPQSSGVPVRGRTSCSALPLLCPRPGRSGSTILRLRRSFHSPASQGQPEPG